MPAVNGLATDQLDLRTSLQYLTGIQPFQDQFP